MSVQEGSFRAFVNRIGKVPLAAVASEAKTSLYVFLFFYTVTIVVWLIVRWVGRMIVKPGPGADQTARYAIIAVAVIWGIVRRKEVFARCEDLFATLKRAPFWMLSYFATIFALAWLVTAYLPLWVWFGYYFAAVLFTISMVSLHDKGVELENEASKNNHVRIVADGGALEDLTLFESLNVTYLHVEPSHSRDLPYDDNGVALDSGSVEYDSKRYAIEYIAFAEGECTISLCEQS
jgi:hypothetical protein